MNIKDQDLRTNALVFYEADMQAIESILEAFLKKSAAKCSLLVDQDGHMITARGMTQNVDLDTISALVAGSFAATKEMAKLLGEEHFACLFHQGERDNIQLSLVGDRTLLTILFDDRTTVGMVRLYAGETAKKLAEVYQECIVKNEEQGGPELDQAYGDSAKEQLDNLFN